MLFLCLGIGADMHATLHAASKLEGAVAQREQGVVLASADVLAGMELGAALTNDDVAGANMLTAEHLHAESLCVRVATVAAGA